MSIPNIVFVGKAGAGKTTAAQLLIDRFPDLGFDVISFATPVKVMMGTLTDRARLQEFGTDIVRRYDPDAWVRLFQWHLDLRTQLRDAENASDLSFGDPNRWCNDDCRFANEVQALQDAGWAVVEVVASEVVRIDRLKRNGKWSEGMFDHESENALGDVEEDWTIWNQHDDEHFVVRSLGYLLEHLAKR